jgi:hypothetical protein
MVEKECNPHPNAPHGFLRQASHSAGRYVCECEWWSEKDYELAALEEAEAFDKKRNYTYQEVDMNAIMIDALKELNLKVEALKARVEHMEKCPWDEWKPTKDIV